VCAHAVGILKSADSMQDSGNEDELERALRESQLQYDREMAAAMRSTKSLPRRTSTNTSISKKRELHDYETAWALMMSEEGGPNDDSLSPAVFAHPSSSSSSASHAADLEYARRLQAEEDGKTQAAQSNNPLFGGSQPVKEQLMETAARRQRQRSVPRGGRPARQQRDRGRGRGRGRDRGRNRGRSRASSQSSSSHRGWQGGMNVDQMSYNDLLAFEERQGNVKSSGASDGMIASLPSTVVPSSLASDRKSSSPSDPDCAICLCAFEHGDEILTLPCFHRFHKKEISDWLKINNTCPICKHSLS
jgi:hypothetical protein